jgi:hypothetical protein
MSTASTPTKMRSPAPILETPTLSYKSSCVAYAHIPEIFQLSEGKSQNQRVIIAKEIFSRESGGAPSLAFPPEAPDTAPMNARRSHLTLRPGALGAALLLLTACGADSGGATGGTGGTPTPEGCDPVDAVCPVARPLSGTPCVAGLSCVYEATRADPATFTLTCPDARWVEDIDCEAAGVGGACGLPVFTEFCESPTLSNFGARGRDRPRRPG